MSQEKMEAVVLRGVDFSETSRIVTFLTPRRGRMACMARGARGKRSPLAAALDSFNRVELVVYWKDGRQVQTLGEVTVLDAYAGIKSDLERGAYAAFPIEVAAKTAHENEPSETLYAALTRGLDGLDAWRGDARAHCCWQLMRLLGAAGFAPTLFECAECGKPLEGTARFAFSGGAVCGTCPSDRRISAGALASLRALQAAETACPPIEDGEEIFGLLRWYAARQLDTEFRSVRVIETMLGGRF